jgi:ribulose-phosphate 3-epimerase
VVSPDTPVSAVDRWLDELDVIMIMSVHPGWGGQGFIPETAPKIATARARLAKSGRGGLVHVDGGVNSRTADVVGAYGIDVCVVGSALFQRGHDASAEVALVKELALSSFEAAASGATR